MKQKIIKNLYVCIGRFMVSRWGDATPEVFSQKPGRTRLPNRNVEAALRFVERIDAAMSSLETERRV